MEILSFQPVGAFMVRRSGSSMGYALSMKTPNNKIVHYLISELPGGGVQLQVYLIKLLCQVIHADRPPQN